MSSLIILCYLFLETFQDQRLYTDGNDFTDQELLENAYEIDEPENETEGHLPGPDQLGHGSASRKSPQKAKGHRRELVWKSQSATLGSLQEIGRHYQASLARFRSENILVHRRGHSATQIIHRCLGYKRTEIILTPDIERSSIVSHESPVPNEICSICGEDVGTAEIFDCSCGLPSTS